MRRGGWGAGAFALGLGCAASPPELPSASEGDPSTSTGEAESSGSPRPEVPITTSSTGDAVTTDAPSADETTDAPPPGSCGDGIVDSREPCDDGNTSEVDGCTSVCAVGPNGLAFGRASDTDLVIGGFGTGSMIERECPDGAVLVGLDAYLSAFAPSLSGVTGLCAPLGLVDADPTSISIGDVQALRGVADDTGTFDPLHCPAGSAFDSLGLTVGGLSFVSMGGTCRTLGVQGSGGAQSLVLGAPAALPEIISGGPLELTATCPDGEVAVGLIGQVSITLAAVGLRCRPLELAYP
jgi:cysteine-rich repeat protein